MAGAGFRFGISADATRGRASWQDAARRAEDVGFDVLLVADHLNQGAPLPALMSAAAVTTRIRLGTIVLNAGFYRPALLARETAGLHRFTDGRFELGLGAGSVAAEFAAAELPFPSPRQRVEHLEHTVVAVRRMLAEGGHPVPLLVGGSGDRVLGLAARHADIVHIGGASGPHADLLTRRIDTIRAAAGDRFPALELGLHFHVVHVPGRGDLDLGVLSRLHPGLSEADLLALPGVLVGSQDQIAEHLHHLREEHGVTYVTTSDHGSNQLTLADLFDRLR